MNAPTRLGANYQLFGLSIDSEIVLPELIQATGSSRPGVTIRLGRVEGDPAESVHNEGEAIILNFPGIARYRVEAGQAIVIDPEPGVPERNLRLYLLGSAFGALLHQRGMLPLHANAVEIGGRAIAFMGESGAGKSTLAAWFHDRGYKVLADDVCAIGFDEDGAPYAHPGLRRLRLWDEALSRLGRDSTNYQRSYAGAERVDKFDVPIERDDGERHPAALASIYLLQRGDEFSVTELKGVEAAEALFAHTYRGAFLPLINGQKRHWESAVNLVRMVSVYRIVRPWDLMKLDRYCAELLKHVETVAACEEHAA